MATGHKGNSTITITNLLSQTPFHFIDTDMEIEVLALTGNVLLALDFETIAAWLLTEEGAVDGVFGDRRAGHGDSIWTVPLSGIPEFSVEDQTAIIKEGGNVIHVYHTETGEVLMPTQTPSQLPKHWYKPVDIYWGRHYPHHKLGWDNTCSEGSWQVPPTIFQEGWVKDPEGKYRMWMPVEWREPKHSGGWLYNITTLWLHLQGDKPIIIKF
jgi:hypothetical protein